MKGLTVYDDALNRGLPKWPAITVIGDDVSQTQAAEILIRTDGYMPDFEYASNSRDLNERLSEIFGLPIHRLDHSKTSAEERFDIMVPHWNAVERLKKRLGILPLEYLTNYQIASSYIGGPHGWVNWYGRVMTSGHNIGKWPGIETVAHEWVTIAKAFPFLNLRCQLYDKESCEEGATPVVTFEVEKGQVAVRRPEGELIGLDQPDFQQMAFNIATLSSMARESGIPVHLLRDKVLEVYGRIPKYKLSKKDIEDRKALRKKQQEEAAK